MRLPLFATALLALAVTAPATQASEQVVRPAR